MLFTELLTQTGLTAETVSHGLKTKIKRYNRVQKAVDEAKEKLKNPPNETLKKKIESEISTGEETLSKWNEELCAGIKNFHDNIELNKKKAENLKKARDARQNNKEGEGKGEDKKPAKVIPMTEPTVASVAKSIIDSGGKVIGKEVIAFYKENEQAVKDEIAKINKKDDVEEVVVKKKSNAVAWLFGGIAVAVLAVIGVNLYNKNK